MSKQKTHHIRLSHNKQKSLDFSVRRKKKKKSRPAGGQRLEDVVVGVGCVCGEGGEKVLLLRSCVCVFLRLDQTPAKD